MKKTLLSCILGCIFGGVLAIIVNFCVNVFKKKSVCTQIESRTLLTPCII